MCMCVCVSVFFAESCVGENAPRTMASLFFSPTTRPLLKLVNALSGVEAGLHVTPRQRERSDASGAIR